MEQKISPSKSALQFGILFGVFMVLEFVVLYIIDIDPITNPTVGTVTNTLNYLVLPIALIAVGCNNYKKKLNAGFISFGECLKIGVSICLIASLIFALFSVAFNLIFPEFMEEVLKKMRQVMLQKSPDMTSEQLQVVMSWTKKSMSPMFAIPITVAMFSFFGLIYSLIIGLIVKNDRPESF